MGRAGESNEGEMGTTVEQQLKRKEMKVTKYMKHLIKNPQIIYVYICTFYMSVY